jgi:hypothetical protein
MKDYIEKLRSHTGATVGRFARKLGIPEDVIFERVKGIPDIFGVIHTDQPLLGYLHTAFYLESDVRRLCADLLKPE